MESLGKEIQRFEGKLPSSTKKTEGISMKQGGNQPYLMIELFMLPPEGAPSRVRVFCHELGISGEGSGLTEAMEVFIAKGVAAAKVRNRCAEWPGIDPANTMTWRDGWLGFLYPGV